MSDTDKKVWLITGAGRGMGVNIAKAALATVADLQEQIDAYRDLSTSLALDDLQPAGNRR